MTQLFAILDADTITGHGTARSLWGGVSFPSSGPEPEWLTTQGAVVIRSDLEHNPTTHYLQRCEPYLLDGQVWNVEAVERPPTPDPLPEPRWQEFRAALRGIPELQTLVATLATVDPIGHLAIGVGLGQAAQGDSATFTGVWTELLAAGLVTPDLAAAVQALAAGFDLPEAFVAGLNPQPPESGPITYPEGWDPPEVASRFDTYTAPDGSEWVLDQPRNADGTYMADDPETEEVESALGWFLASP